MKTTLDPMLALFNLGGAEIILILIVLIIPALALAGGIVIFLILRGARNKPASVTPSDLSAARSTPPARQCPQCGALLKSDAPEGLCPACLLQRGIATEGAAPPGAPPFTPPPLAELAKLFPQLEILEMIGQGGMGAVYKARQPSLDRFVALKILAPRSGGDLDFSGRFSREARALAKLSHPNIVGVYDFGQIPRSRRPEEAGGAQLPGNPPPDVGGYAGSDLSYFLMEYVDGPNLRQIEKAGKLTPREALEIIPQICAALQFAHDEGIVHRDIKPENVLLDKKGRVKIADFGLAKILGQEADFRLTGARDVMGTPHYMAPEQVEKPQEVDHRADIYSLGVVFYEMLTGELPLGKFDPPSHKVQIDVRLDDVVLRSLANNPDRRYQQVSEVKTELESIASSRNVPASQPARFVGTSLGIAVGAFVAVLCIAILGLLAAVAIPNFIKGRNAARAQRASASAVVNTNAAVEANVSTNPPASVETWAPILAPGAKPDLMAILQEARELRTKQRYEESLQRQIWYHNHSLSDPAQLGVRNSFALSDWVELGRRYPKAMQALIEIRDEDTRKFSSGEGYFELFMEIAAINDQLGNQENTRVLFQQLAASPDKKLTQQCYPIAQGVLVSHGDYELCMNFIGDPEDQFKKLQDQWQRSKEWEQQRDDMRRRMNERDRATQKNLESNGVLSASAPHPAILSLPKLADKTFVAQTRQLIEILLGAGRENDASRIRDEAILLLDDPGLKSAVDDAEKAIHAPRQMTPQNRAPAPGSILMPPPVASPPAIPLPPPGSVIRPLRSLREASNGLQRTTNAQTPLPNPDETLLLAQQPPVVVETFPTSGAFDVPAGEIEIRVRFSKAMAAGSWSWSTAWENSTPESIGEPHYLNDGRTCVMKVRLEPGRTYAWWLNSDKFHNFKDQSARPAVPYLLIFQTKPN